MVSAWLVLSILTFLQAAIPLSEIQTFDAAPNLSEWSTAAVAGNGASITTGAQLDAAAQSFAVANGLVITNRISKRLGSSVAQWHSNEHCLITQPTDSACTLILATIQNSTESDVPNPAVSFDLKVPASLAGEDAELAGYRVYLSPYGVTNTWLHIPHLSGYASGRKSAVLPVTSWPPGTVLYLLWVDDNGSVGIDAPLSIDNFQIAPTPAQLQFP